MKRVWTTPTGEYFSLYKDMLKQPHLLIAGATGSGKSVVINGLVYTALYDSPAAVQFILIDPKRVELVDYKILPHTLQYASEPGDMVQALEKAMEITEARYPLQTHPHSRSPYREALRHTGKPVSGTGRASYYPACPARSGEHAGRSLRPSCQRCQ